MELNEQNKKEDISQFIIDFIEEIKEVLSSNLWENMFLNCSKNEVLVFWLLYRRHEVNMTEIAEYIHVPLNTATGIINRMEKNGLIVRERSREDKRVVNIGFSEKGMAQFEALIGELTYYGMKIAGSLTKQEMELFYKMTSKVREVLKEEHRKEETPKKIRKITIE